MEGKEKILVAVLSDTHGLLRREVVAEVRKCAYILHAGDIAKPEILDKLRQIAPIKVVRGNNDRAWAEDLPMQLAFELEGYRFFMTHKKRDIPGDVDADIVIFGHSHKYEEFRDGSILFLNPGSCGPRRFTQPITLMLMDLGDGPPAVKKVEIEHKFRKMNTPLPSDLNLIIIGAVRDIQKGLSVPEIAGKYNISEDFAEQICRMYLTHPGIDAQGVINKMELYSRGL